MLDKKEQSSNKYNIAPFNCTKYKVVIAFYKKNLFPFAFQQVACAVIVIVMGGVIRDGLMMRISLT